MEVLDYIYQSLDAKEHVAGIYLDLKKAFDTVDHEILLWKLYIYGIRCHIIEWFKSCLSNRRQYTSVNGYQSEELLIKYGIPQGSVL